MATAMVQHTFNMYWLLYFESLVVFKQFDVLGHSRFIVNWLVVVFVLIWILQNSLDYFIVYTTESITDLLFGIKYKLA